MYRPALIIGSLLGALAVALGAFGAHKLKEIVEPVKLEVWNKGVQYHFYHVFAMLAAGILYSNFPTGTVKNAYLYFLAGILLFSGSLYVITFIKDPKDVPTIVGVATPIGGLFFIAGWVCLFLGLLKK